MSSQPTVHLDLKHLREISNASQSSNSPPPNLETNFRRTSSPENPFQDVCLADTPRNTVAIGKFSAQGTPIKIIPLDQSQNTPSPTRSQKTLRLPSHERIPSNAHSLPDLGPSARSDLMSRQHSADFPQKPNLFSNQNDGDHQSLAGSSAKDLEGRVSISGNDGIFPLDENNVSSNATLKSWKSYIARELLLFLTIFGVLVGILLGFALRPANLSSKPTELIALPGEIMLRLLKMLVLPLVAGSMISGVCALRSSESSIASVARNTILYYFCTTLTAVILGIALVNVINPGRGEPLADSEVSNCHGETISKAPSSSEEKISALEALLTVIRSIFPDNIAVAAVNMNILGIITISLLFGLALASIGKTAEPIINAIDVFNSCIAKIVKWVLWITPIGVASLIASAMIRACDLSQTVIALGMWVLTVLIGLTIFGVILLPFLLWLVTRQSPWTFLRKFSKALVLAFGTSSSSAALPVAMECARNFGCNESIIKFVLPLGTTINMNGTALYEATTVIFIAQAHGVRLGFAGTLVVAFTATLAAVGAAAIPSAGLVTMLMVLNAVNLEQFAGDLAIILAIDWLLDRCRTAVNLMSDCLAVVFVDHLAKFAHGPEYSQIEMSV